MLLSRVLALQPHAIPQPAFNRSQVIYYQASEYLPPLDTLAAKSATPRKADPELARQPIISLPREADNREQTIVAPPAVKLKQHVAMPNVVAWSDRQVPKLAIPPAPLTPAAQISRIAPKLENVIAAPPQEVTGKRRSMAIQTAIVAPPSDVPAARAASHLDSPEPSVIAPPPNVVATTRTLGEMNIARANIINPAPQLAVNEQRAISGGRSSVVGAGAPQIVAPPPSLGSTAAAGSPGRVIALNLHPAIGAPADPPPGNRRAAFSATPSGHPGVTGIAGERSGDPNAGGAAHGGSSKENGLDPSTRRSSDLPSGLYVGKSEAKTSPVAGDPGLSKPIADPNLVASATPPRVTGRKPMQPGNPARLNEAERSVFGDRKFYSLTLNMPNLNSAGGSWVIRFAELNRDFGPHAADQPASDLSQPAATRKVDPAYPLQLMRENVAGTVILYAIIHADGTVGDVRVLRGVDDRLDQFAKEAVSQWKFDPATKNGAPVDIEATFQIPFKPPRPGSTF